MVKSVKNCLRKSLGHFLLKLIELQTLLAKIQAVINDRPITFVYDDDEGITYPLTPAELLHGRRITSYNDKIFEIRMKLLPREPNTTRTCYVGLQTAGTLNTSKAFRRSLIIYV